MGKLYIRDKANGSWLDVFCSGKYFVRNANNTAWVQMTVLNTFIRNSTNTGWIQPTCPVPVTYVGGLFTFGYNGTGMLGLADNVDRTVPTQVGTVLTWAKIGLGADFGVYAQSNGAGYASGGNFYGQLGLGNTTNTNALVSGGGAGAAHFACGAQHSVIQSSLMYSTGRNLEGELGLGDTANRLSWTNIPNLSAVKIACGANFTMMIQANGTLVGFGNNSFGQLGTGATALSVPTPVQIGLNTYSDVSCCGASVLAVRTDGTLWACGQNSSGQLGLGDTVDRLTLTQVSGTGWSKVVCGASHVVAVKTDGTVWAWGNNASGQLGLGDLVNRSLPTQITTYSKVSCGANHVLALKADGTVWSWGSNSNGQLGLGDLVNRSLPTQIVIPNVTFSVNSILFNENGTGGQCNSSAIIV